MQEANCELSPDLVWGQRGYEFFNKSDYPNAIDCFIKAFKLNPNEITWQLNLSMSYYTIGKFPAAQQVLEDLWETFPDEENRKQTLMALADVHFYWGKDLSEKYDHLNAIKHYEEAYRINKDLRPKIAAMCLNNIGFIYASLGNKKEALDYYEQALPHCRAVGYRHGEAKALNNIGMVYYSLGEKEKALGYYEQALPIYQDLKNRGGEATILNNIGGTYYSLDEKEKALGYYEQVLPIVRAIGDRSGEARTLNNIGAIYSSFGEKKEAMGYYEEAFGEKKEALRYYEEALLLRRAIGDRSGEATTLNNIGGIYYSLGEKEKALGYYEQSLPLRSAVGDRSGEATTLNNLMYFWDALNNKPMAIFYGKQAVNGFQHLRENIVNLDKEIKNSYLKTKKEKYRDLINLLIGQRRLDETLLVLDMLKAEEYYQFIQKDSSSLLPDRQYHPLKFTPFEQRWLQQYNTLMGNISKISSKYQELFIAKPKNETEQLRLTQLETQLKEANKAYDQYLIQLKTAFAEHDQKIKIGEYDGLNLASKPNSIQSTLRLLDKTVGGKNVTLHYFVYENKIQIILTTPTFQIVQSSSLNQIDLNDLVNCYKEAIRYYRSRGVVHITDLPSETAPFTSTELYDLVFKPIEKDLKDYGATNLMVYLDGVLRYIPLPVLFDGQNFLVQRYRISNLTTSSLLNVKDDPIQNLKILGMAASKGSTGVSHLPNASAEIRNIVNDASSGCNGFINGKALVDEKFTKTTMLQQLKTFSFPLVHIASHFNFSSENETQNFLMLGDSTKLTLKDIRQEGNLFKNVDMLVLSACQTAMGTSDGVEIDGFGELAQKSGAKSVVASLWLVDDKSSKDLMVSFYRNIKEHRFSSKIEAMRQAQLELAGLDDFLQPNPQHKREKTDYASPYYWGPFILMGNWR